MLIAPSLQGRPKVSLMMTATFFPEFCKIPFLISEAEESGLMGKRTTVWLVPALEASIPEFAQINPWVVSVIRIPLSILTILTDSRKTSSTSLASLSHLAA